MADREKLIELINKSMNNCPPNVGGCRNYPYFIGSESDWCDDSASIADHLIANGVTIQKWIPVTERLPEKDKEVLCLLGNGECWVAVWDHCDDGLWTDGEWWRAKNFVTHWMYLPQPPKGE